MNYLFKRTNRIFFKVSLVNFLKFCAKTIRGFQIATLSKVLFLGVKLANSETN